MQVYLDNGATTMVAEEVVDLMNEYFTDKYGNASSLHYFGREASKAVENARRIIAKKINAEPEEIIFTSGGTESDNLAIKGIIGEKKHIITTKIEHPAVLNTAAYLEQNGCKVTYLDVDSDGFVDLRQLEKSITKDTAIVSVMHVNNEIGTIQNIKEIGEICKKKRVLFHTDAVQSFTKVPIDVKKMNIDLISLSAHKIHGPKGIGALYVKKGIKLNPEMLGGAHEFKKRAGTENVPGIIGFAKAAELAEEKHIKEMETLRDYMIKELLKIPRTRLNGPKKARVCNNINVTFDGIEGEAILLHLDSRKIAVSTGSACSSKSLKPSHVLSAIGLPPEKSHGSIRITLSRYTTKEEINYALKAINEVVEQLRKISPM